MSEELKPMAQSVSKRCAMHGPYTDECPGCFEKLRVAYGVLAKKNAGLTGLVEDAYELLGGGSSVSIASWMKRARRAVLA